MLSGLGEMGDGVAENRYFWVGYWWMARNTGGWRETLADGEKYWRMARNTGG